MYGLGRENQPSARETERNDKHGRDDGGDRRDLGRTRVEGYGGSRRDHEYECIGGGNKARPDAWL